MTSFRPGEQHKVHPSCESLYSVCLLYHVVPVQQRSWPSYMLQCYNSLRTTCNFLDKKKISLMLSVITDLGIDSRGHRTVSGPNVLFQDVVQVTNHTRVQWKMNVGLNVRRCTNTTMSYSNASKSPTLKILLKSPKVSTNF